MQEYDKAPLISPPPPPPQKKIFFQTLTLAPSSHGELGEGGFYGEWGYGG